MVGTGSHNVTGRFVKELCILLLCSSILSCGDENIPVAYRNSEAKTSDGLYISWKEHLIDGLDISGVALSGSDGLIMGDLDLDGYQDIVSVHEADTDTVFNGLPRGHIRLAFGSDNPNVWELVTLAEGIEASAAEDVAIGDMNQDGWPDILAACELAHIIYFQNPGKAIRNSRWERVIPPLTLDRGSFIRVFCADFNGDGQLEVTAPNKGTHHPLLTDPDLYPISWFEITGNPLEGYNWTEHVLTRVTIPDNASPVDLDGDGDLDILGSSRGEKRIMWFENLGESSIAFREHSIDILRSDVQFPAMGVNVEFQDFNADGRLDIVVLEYPYMVNIGWIEQPADPSGIWVYNQIGTVSPDRIIGLAIADINGDGHPDLMTGTYSLSSRESDGDVTVNDNLGRLAWFEHPGNAYDNWIRHDFSRRIRGMFDKFIPMDMDMDGDIDFVTTRGNSFPYDGVLWLEQVRSKEPLARFIPARESDSREMGLPKNE